MVGSRTDPRSARPKGRVIAAVVVGCATLATTLWLDWPALLVPAALAVLTLAVLDRRQLPALLNKWLWLGLALAVVLPIWLVGTPGDRTLPHVGGGVSALTAGLAMAARVLTTLVVLLLIGGCLAPASVSRAVGRLVGKELGLACAIGVNLLPAVLEILRRTTLALRLRGGFAHHRLANLKRLVTAVGVQTVRLTEDVAEALLLAQAPAPPAAEPDNVPTNPGPRRDVVAGPHTRCDESEPEARVRATPTGLRTGHARAEPREPTHEPGPNGR